MRKTEGLSISELTLSKDEKGRVGYAKNNLRAELSSDAQQLVTAIDDHSAQVQLTANTNEQSPVGSQAN